MKTENEVFVVYKGIDVDKRRKAPFRRHVEVVPFDPDIHVLQELVGGYFEHLFVDPALTARHIDMWINEEGKFHDDLNPTMAILNKRTGDMIDYIVGPCVFSTIDQEGVTHGLSLDDMNVVINWINTHRIVGLRDVMGNEIPVLAWEFDAGN